MSLFGDIGNIFHSIGHFFNGDNNQNNNQQHNQPQIAVHPSLTGPTVAPIFNNNQNQQNNNNNQNRPQNNNQNRPQNNNQIQQPQQQQQGPFFQLYQGPNNSGTYDPNSPVTQRPQNQPSATPSKPHASILHDITHNPITNALGTGAKDAGSVAAGTGLGVLRAGEGLVQGVTDIPKIAVDVGTWAGDKLSGTHVRPQFVKNIDQWTSDVDKPQQWLQKKTDEASQAFGQPGADVYKPVQIGTNVATLLPAASAVVSKVGQLGDLTKAAQGSRIAAGAQQVVKGADALNNFVQAQRNASPAMQLLDKVKGGISDQLHSDWGIGNDNVGTPNKMGTATDTKVAAGIQQPHEVTPGVSSVNPNQGADALKVIQQKEAEAIANQVPMGPDGQPVETTPTGKSPTEQTTPPLQGAPAPIQGETAPAPLNQNPNPAPQSVEPSMPQNFSFEPPVSDMPNNVAQTPHNVNGRTAPNAPNVRDQAGKELQDLGKQEDSLNPADRNWWQKATGSSKQHDVFSNEDLNQAADRYVATKSDEELLHDYGRTENQRPTINSSADLAKAFSSIKRLGPIAAKGDERAAQAISDILDAAESHVSSSGRTLNYAGSMYDSLPKEAKAAYLVKSIDKAREAAGLAPLTDQEAALANQDINALLDKGEGFMQAATEAQGRIEALRDAAKAGGELPPDAIKQIYGLDKVAQDNILKAQATQGELASKYGELTPAARTGESIGKDAGNLGRSLMLTSIGGRFSDIATTSINMLHGLAQNSIEAGIGKLANAKRAVMGQTPGKYIDKAPSGNALVHGTNTGLQKAAGNYAGKSYVEDTMKAVKSKSAGGKAQLDRADGSGLVKWVKNTAHAMAETATNLSQGTGNTRVLQLAYQEGKQAGLKGDELDVYAHATAAMPSRAVAAKGKQLVDEVNNMNDNPISHGLNQLAKGFDKVPVVGDSIRNVISPFNQWIGGQAWNGITDKNAIANIIKMGRAMKGGDSQEAMHQFAGLITNTAGAMSVGYGLAQAGVLTTHNAEGYNDDGLYLHLGNHYVPVGFFGFAAPGIVMGAATHSAIHDQTPGKSVAQKVMDAAGRSFDELASAYLHNTTIGGGNQLTTDIQNAIQHKNGGNWGDVGINAVADAAGNYIPGITGDINSAINTYNIGGLNPNHEAGMTKVTKGANGEVGKNGLPSKAKDAFGSDVNQLLNRLPVIGQKTVPRNPGVNAQDPIDRVTRGDSESPEQAKVNSAVDTLPANQQQDAFKLLRKSDGTAIAQAQQGVDGLTGPAKIKAQQGVDKMKFAAENGSAQQVVNDIKAKNQVDAVKSQLLKAGNTTSSASGPNANTTDSGKMQTVNGKTYAVVGGKVSTFDNPQAAQSAIDMQKFKDSGKQSATINGKYYNEVNGKYNVTDNQFKAQRAIDEAKFKAGNQKTLEVNGMHYERGSDGKITAMEQKDYDYKTASDQIKEAANSNDMNGMMKGQQALLGNIQWQLNHADLTDANRTSLIDTAAKTQADHNKYQLWGQTTRPKDAPTYDPKFTGGNDKSSGYIKSIKELGVKYGVDVNALMSVASAEGLGGGVGDGGHAFGPFQMNDAGGVLTGKFKSPQEAQAYAESPQGIEDAIKQIAAVVGNKTGPDAVKAIVTQFERPADPDGEIARALSVYEGGNVDLPTSPTGSAAINGGTSITSDSSSASKEASLIKENVIGNLPVPARLSFIENGLTAKPITPNIPQIRLTAPDTLIKAHKITVGSPKA